jgi:outer membrane murein-binding lipoprotein Lpp
MTMKKMILLLAAVVMALVVSGCASVPEGFENQERKALEAKAEADTLEAQKDMPLEYEAAESVLKTAQAKKDAEDYKASMSLYQEAEKKYVQLNKSVKKKRETDQYMKETVPYVDSVEKKIDQADKKKK